MSGEDFTTVEEMVVHYGFESSEDFNNLVAQYRLETMLDVALFRKWQSTDGTKAGLVKLLDEQKERKE